jgi:hypothetical protein
MRGGVEGLAAVAADRRAAAPRLGVREALRHVGVARLALRRVRGKYLIICALSYNPPYKPPHK